MIEMLLTLSVLVNIVVIAWGLTRKNKEAAPLTFFRVICREDGFDQTVAIKPGGTFVFDFDNMQTNGDAEYRWSLPGDEWKDGNKPLGEAW